MSNTKSVSITIRMDESLKKNFEEVLDDIGLSVSSAFTVFAKAVTKERKIPFSLEADPFYSEKNLQDLEKSVKELDNGHYVVKTLDELKGMEKWKNQYHLVILLGLITFIGNLKIKTLKKINSLIESLCRGNLIAKAEKLKGNKCSSLRINSKDRLVFRLIE